MGLREQEKKFRRLKFKERIGAQKEWVLSLVLQEGALVGMFPENEGLKEVEKKLQNKIIAYLTVYPEWGLNIHCHDFSF